MGHGALTLPRILGVISYDACGSRIRTAAEVRVPWRATTSLPTAAHSITYKRWLFITIYLPWLGCREMALSDSRQIGNKQHQAYPHR